MQCARLTHTEYVRLSNSSDNWVCTVCIHKQQETQLYNRLDLQQQVEEERKQSRFPCGERHGREVIQFVGFDRHQHTTLKNFCQKATPIRLNNCVVQMNKLSGKLEITLKSYTVIEKSSTTFQVENLVTLGSQEISLIDLKDTNDYDKVTDRIKVLRIIDPETVGKEKTKQEVYVADATAVANVTIWEDDINTFKPGASYQLNHFSVHSYRGKKHLLSPQLVLHIKKSRI